MIERVDYTKYLSYDNGKGLLISSNDVFILERYGIDYSKCSSISDLIFRIGEFMENDSFGEEIGDLEEVLYHLQEVHYYQETKK